MAFSGQSRVQVGADTHGPHGEQESGMPPVWPHAVRVDRARHRRGLLPPVLSLPCEHHPPAAPARGDHKHSARHRLLELQGQELPRNFGAGLPSAILIMRHCHPEG